MSSLSPRLFRLVLENMYTLIHLLLCVPRYDMLGKVWNPISEAWKEVGNEIMVNLDQSRKVRLCKGRVQLKNWPMGIEEGGRGVKHTYSPSLMSLWRVIIITLPVDTPAGPMNSWGRVSSALNMVSHCPLKNMALRSTMRVSGGIESTRSLMYPRVAWLTSSLIVFLAACGKE